MQWAQQLQSKMDELFWDDVGGGYFNTATGVFQRLGCAEFGAAV